MLNAAHRRVKMRLSVKDEEWQRAIKQAGADLGLERRLLHSAWAMEKKPQWGTPQLSRRTDSMKARDKATQSGIPGWVADIVPEPFGPDEIEEEVWRLEESGAVPSGTFTRLYGRDAKPRPSGEFGLLTVTEVDEAAKLGVRSVDIDEKVKRDRERWRETKRRSMF